MTKKSVEIQTETVKIPEAPENIATQEPEPCLEIAVPQTATIPISAIYSGEDASAILESCGGQSILRMIKF